MSTKQNWNNLGDQYKQSVQEAIHTGDFSKLNRLVSDTVSGAIAEASWQIKQASENVQKDVKTPPPQKTQTINQNPQYQHTPYGNTSYKNTSYGNTSYGNTSYRNTPYSNTPYKNTVPPKPAYPKPQPKTQLQKRMLPVTKTKKVGQVTSILNIVFGSIGAGTSGIIGFIGLIFALIGFGWSALSYIFLFIMFLGSILVIRKGNIQQGRLSRMKRYIALFGNKMYMNIEDLAAQTHKSVPYVQKDIRKMLSLGFFPEGHLDSKGTCLMLDDNTYREYLRVERERNRLALETSAKPAPAQKQPPTDTANQELQIMVKEGQEYIRKLHYLNDIIEDESISEKMDRTESLLQEIFKRVEEAPEQRPKMHKLMNYYLPTTIKLLEAYSQYDDISSPGPDIVSAKEEIEKTIDIINEAFTELLNKLFQASVFDVTTDAQVLQTMLAKEGLTKNNFTEDIKNE